MKLKLRKIGNSLGVLLPKEVTGTLKAGDEIEWGGGQVITEPIKQTSVWDNKMPEPLIKEPFNTEMCSKHPGSMKGTCGCN